MPETGRHNSKPAVTVYIAASVREYVFYVFFQVSKNMTFYGFFK